MTKSVASRHAFTFTTQVCRPRGSFGTYSVPRCRKSVREAFSQSLLAMHHSTTGASSECTTPLPLWCSKKDVSLRSLLFRQTLTPHALFGPTQHPTNIRFRIRGCCLVPYNAGGVMGYLESRVCEFESRLAQGFCSEQDILVRTCTFAVQKKLFVHGSNRKITMDNL